MKLLIETKKNYLIKFALGVFKFSVVNAVLKGAPHLVPLLVLLQFLFFFF